MGGHTWRLVRGYISVELLEAVRAYPVDMGTEDA